MDARPIGGRRGGAGGGVFLKSLEVQNFRGIVSGRLDLDQTTLLIGENDCGKTSLLTALAVVLASGEGGRPVIERHHFHRPVEPGVPLQGPVTISLLFEERSAGEWNASSLGPLAALLPAPSAGRRLLTVVLHAAAPGEGEEPVAHWRIGSPDSGKAASEDNTEHLEILRGRCPLIWLRAGMLAGAPAVEPRNAAPQPAEGRLAELAAIVESHYDSLLAGTSSNELAELKAGYEAARELLQQRAGDVQAASNETRGIVAEVLGTRAGTRSPALRFRGSAAQQIGVLVLTAAVVRHGLDKWAPGTTPLLVIEDPEAHLHPMTLASVWGLIEHVHAQRIVGTQAETLLAAAPMSAVRRLTRHGGRMLQWRVREGVLSGEDLRKLGYHVRVRRGEAMFARCWLLVEGETEFWVLPELARLSGYDLDLEGVAAVEYAQCGLPPLIKLARELGIEWHVLTDGDRTGGDYAAEAEHFAGAEGDWRVTRLRELDVEHCFWHHGYAGIYRQAAGLDATAGGKVSARRVIGRAIKRHSKPQLAFQALAAVEVDGSPGVPPPLKRTIETCVQLAREAPARAGESTPRQPRTRPRRRRRSRRK